MRRLPSAVAAAGHDLAADPQDWLMRRYDPAVPASNPRPTHQVS
jgi:hypothetical protein